MGQHGCGSRLRGRGRWDKRALYQRARGRTIAPPERVRVVAASGAGLPGSPRLQCRVMYAGEEPNRGCCGYTNGLLRPLMD